MLRCNDKLTRGLLPQEISEQAICFSDDAVARERRVCSARDRCKSFVQMIARAMVLLMPGKERTHVSS
jgi:hypothetical protein